MRPIWITAYSPSHEEMYVKHFRSSWLACGLQEHFDFKVHWLNEFIGDFGTEVFNNWGTRQMRWIQSQLKERIGQIVVLSGVDFHFYQPIGKELIDLAEKHEFIAANDVYFPACGDFTAFRVTQRVIDLYEWMIENDPLYTNQEYTLNTGLGNMKFQVHSLPIEYWTAGMGNGGIEWKEGDAIPPVPVGIKLHHANFTRGEKNKLKLLNGVEEIIKDFNERH